jgi:Ca2+-binding EF-hand superfamily protein
MTDDATSFSDDTLREQFRILDVDQDGFVTADELATLLRADGAEVSDEEIAEILQHADDNGDGRLSFEEFRAAMNMTDS